MSKPPVFGRDPALDAADMVRGLQSDLNRINAAAPQGSGVAVGTGGFPGRAILLTPAERQAQVPIQNSTIQRLESEWPGASPSRKRDIVKGIEDILRGFPGTSSSKLAEFKGGRRRRRTRRRMTQRRKKSMH